MGEQMIIVLLMLSVSGFRAEVKQIEMDLVLPIQQSNSKQIGQCEPGCNTSPPGSEPPRVVSLTEAFLIRLLPRVFPWRMAVVVLDHMAVSSQISS